MPDQSSSEQNPSIQPWEILESTRVFDEPWFPIRRDTVKLPSGRVIDDYFVWESPDIAIIVPITPEGNFVTLKQYRHAANEITVQFPAGAVDKDETPEDAARRELREETGFVSSDFIQLVESAPYPTKLTGRNYIFLARNAIVGTGKEKNDMEETEIQIKTAAEIEDLIDRNGMLGDQAIAGFFLAQRYLQQEAKKPKA